MATLSVSAFTTAFGVTFLTPTILPTAATGAATGTDFSRCRVARVTMATVAKSSAQPTSRLIFRFEFIGSYKFKRS